MLLMPQLKSEIICFFFAEVEEAVLTFSLVYGTSHLLICVGDLFINVCILFLRMMFLVLLVNTDNQNK